MSGDLEIELQAILGRLKVLMLVDDELGTRASRAYEALTTDPFIPSRVWTVAQAIAWKTCAVVYSGERGTRDRANSAVGPLLRTAAESKATLGRTA